MQQWNRGPSGGGQRGGERKGCGVFSFDLKTPAPQSHQCSFNLSVRCDIGSAGILKCLH